MKRALIAAAFALAAGTADAALINFDLTTFTGNTGNHTSTAGGETLTVGANGGPINRGSNGFGVQGNPESGRLGAGETLNFTVSSLIDSLTLLIFETGNENEGFRVSVNGVTADYTIAGGDDGASFVTFDVSSLVPATGVLNFSVIGLEPNAGGNRGVRVAGVTVNTVTVPAVPLPAGGVLLLTGLAALGLRRRKG